MKALILSILFISVYSYQFAQKGFTLYNMKSTPQANYLNPAFMPKAKFYFAIAPIGYTSIGISNSGFVVNDLLTRRSDDSLELNTTNFLGKLKKLNYASFDMQNEIMALGFHIEDIYVNMSITNRLQSNMSYPKDLFQLAIEGNGKNFIGQRASMDGLGIDLSSYMEYGFGLTKVINDKLTVGGRLKFISGIVNVKTVKSEFGLYTDPTTFALTVDGSVEVNSSNIDQLFNEKKKSGEFRKEIKDLKGAGFNFENFGLGIDLGGSYKINEKFSVNASVLDLGRIKWKANVKNYKSDDMKFTFEGFDLNQYLADTSANPLSNITDTLQTFFKGKDNANSYSTPLFAKLYLGGNYQLTKSLNAGVLFFNEFIKGAYRPAFSISGNAQLKNWLVASLNYTMYNRAYNNIGFGVSMNGGPFQVYFLTDNILGLFNALAAKNVHVSGGFSFYIKGKKKKTDPASPVDKPTDFKP